MKLLTFYSLVHMHQDMCKKGKENPFMQIRSGWYRKKKSIRKKVKKLEDNVFKILMLLNKIGWPAIFKKCCFRHLRTFHAFT